MGTQNQPTPGSQLSSVDRALRLLEHLSTFPNTTIALVDLAKQLDLNKSTLHHTLATLRQRGWVEQDQTGAYRLGATTAKLATWWENTNQTRKLNN